MGGWVDGWMDGWMMGGWMDGVKSSFMDCLEQSIRLGRWVNKLPN